MREHGSEKLAQPFPTGPLSRYRVLLDDEEGLAAISLHEVARRVEIRQPSLYAYIDSKMALYDAMFGQAAQNLLDEMTDRDLPADPRAAVRAGAQVLVDLARENPTARQLLFNRTIPGFEPSPASYAPAVDFYLRWVELLRAAGVRTRAMSTSSARWSDGSCSNRRTMSRAERVRPSPGHGARHVLRLHRPPTQT